MSKRTRIIIGILVLVIVILVVIPKDVNGGELCFGKKVIYPFSQGGIICYGIKMPPF